MQRWVILGVSMEVNVKQRVKKKRSIQIAVLLDLGAEIGKQQKRAKGDCCLCLVPRGAARPVPATESWESKVPNTKGPTWGGVLHQALEIQYGG